MQVQIKTCASPVPLLHWRLPFRMVWVHGVCSVVHQLPTYNSAAYHLLLQLLLQQAVRVLIYCVGQALIAAVQVLMM